MLCRAPPNFFWGKSKSPATALPRACYYAPGKLNAVIEMNSENVTCFQAFSLRTEGSTNLRISRLLSRNFNFGKASIDKIKITMLKFIFGEKIMKNKVFLCVPGLLIFLLCLFGGCNTDIGDDANDTAAIKIVPVTPRELQKPIYADPAAAEEAAAFVGGANDFAFRLSAALAVQTNTKNMVCSPLSVWIPLAALVNAVNAQHKAELLRALSVPDLEDAGINNGVSRMLYDLTRQQYKEYGQGNYHDPIKIVNAIFVDRDVTIKDQFAQAFMDYYRGSSINVDFKSPSAVIEVNEWADKNTNGTIREIIQEFAPGTLAVIANAIYFFDRWAWEFDPDDTREDIFYASSGETRASYMLREGEGQIYYEDERLQAMPLSFKTNSSLYILLPKDGDAAGLLKSLTNNYFRTIQDGSEPARGKLLLPRFSIEGDVMQLNDILIRLGIPLFGNDDPLPGVIQERALRLSEALHKAVIKVDEKGATAAAVTLLEMDAISAGPPDETPEKVFEMNCNKPFVFVLYDYTYGGAQVLFTGIVNQP
jgi:serine protease inhibitor